MRARRGLRRRPRRRYPRRVEHSFDWASVTKLATAVAVLVAVEEGIVDLDEPAGPPGSTVRHLLAHASGLPFEEGAPIAKPGERRIYSNAGFEVVGRHVAEQRRDGVRRVLRGGVGHSSSRARRPRDVQASLEQLLALAHELLRALAARAARRSAEATHGAVPRPRRRAARLRAAWRRTTGGSASSCADGKRPHWTGAPNSPRTFGHFGGSGTFLWVDPDAGLALGVLTDSSSATGRRKPGRGSPTPCSTELDWRSVPDVSPVRSRAARVSAILDGWRFCPRCATELEPQPDRLHCPGCGADYWANSMPGDAGVPRARRPRAARAAQARAARRATGTFPAGSSRRARSRSTACAASSSRRPGFTSSRSNGSAPSSTPTATGSCSASAGSSQATASRWLPTTSRSSHGSGRTSSLPRWPSRARSRGAAGSGPRGLRRR